MTKYSRYISKDFVISGTFMSLKNAEKTWEEIDGRMRTAVRKAEKSGATIKKMPLTQKSIDTFKSFCLNPDDLPEKLTDRYHLFVAELEQKVVAAILLVEVNDKLFMLCHASLPEAKKQELPSLLLWHAVKEFSGGTFRILDVGASYRASLQKFFSGWKTQGYPMIMKPPELHPTLMLTPFDTGAMGTGIPSDAEALSRKALDEKCAGSEWTFFPRAMYGVAALIRWMRKEGKIEDDGEVWITTTTDTHYVSSCVTTAIEDSAKWSRSLTKKTQVIFVIHEFGFPHPKRQELRKIADERGIPLIEDCAYAWSTPGTGETGDFVLYSLTKQFPVQFGGIVKGKKFSQEELWNDHSCSDANKESYALRMLAPWIYDQEHTLQKRRENYEWYQSIFGKNRTLFGDANTIDPGAFVLKMSDEKTMEQTSEFVRSFGIECGNYWQSSAIILPVHQRLASAHLEYIAGAVLATEREWCGIPFPPHGTRSH